MKRGQSAIEFLITYGWVFLVGLTTIFYLGSLGFINSGDFLPDVCTITDGFVCEDAVFYTLAGAGPPYQGLGFVGLNIKNGLSKQIEHAYVVIDPEDDYCGGFVGILVTPALTPMKPGESRIVKFYQLDKFCGQGGTCAPGKTCSANANLCVDNKGSCGQSLSGEWYCQGQCTCDSGTCGTTGSNGVNCKNNGGHFCADDISNPNFVAGPNCYFVSSFASINYLTCGCIGQNCGVSVYDTFNCCDSSFSHGTSALPDEFETDLLEYDSSFCPGYSATVDPICKYPSVDMTGLDYYTVDFSIVYKFTDSNLFHTAQGYMKVDNSGPVPL